ncbi:hypothetical protein AQUCO_01900157v1 [Aquilegia coerulea]|uniref:Prolamin-like domain-containing protein n=1 Tax=Aquilegia coerulea TaxID=218851 RepID=A0A2G5DJA1_AQUCA|nr:hypothetical protein AQUCO_01900157v1 [Aquilegia coerulea]
MASIQMMIVCIVVVSALMIVPSFSVEAPLRNPVESVVAPPPAFFDYVETCAEKFGTKCPEIGDLLTGKNNIVSEDCCSAIVNIGKQCHDALLTVLLQMDNFKQFSSIISQRDAWLWNYCVNQSTKTT